MTRTASFRRRTPRRPAALALLVAALPAFGACWHAPPPADAAPASPSPFAAELAEFARQDRESPAPEGVVVFVGSSSIRLWSTLAEDFAPVPVSNRGFGGSRLEDAIRHAPDLVSIHDPSVVVVFSGTNDLAGDDAQRPEEVRELFRHLVARLRRPDPSLPIVFVAITPTLARERHVAAVREANRRIREDCEADPRLEFVDPTPDLADAAGRPDPRFFREDRLHLNAAGYAVWTRHLRPVVLRLYERSRARRVRGGARRHLDVFAAAHEP